MIEPRAEQEFSPVEQKLRGKIAGLFEDARQEGVILKWADGFTDAGQVLDLIRETFSELAKEKGYVKLAEDQKLPSSGEVILLDREPFESGYHLGQLRMIEEGWRKVILEVKE